MSHFYRKFLLNINFLYIYFININFYLYKSLFFLTSSRLVTVFSIFLTWKPSSLHSYLLTKVNVLTCRFRLHLHSCTYILLQTPRISLVSSFYSLLNIYRPTFTTLYLNFEDPRNIIGLPSFPKLKSETICFI